MPYAYVVSLSNPRESLKIVQYWDPGKARRQAKGLARYLEMSIKDETFDFPVVTCPHCHKAASFVAEYGRWYCDRCDDYVKYLKHKREVYR
jgi:ribosomal protein S27AE